jgi:hypothetical protein
VSDKMPHTHVVAQHVDIISLDTGYAPLYGLQDIKTPFTKTIHVFYTKTAVSTLLKVSILCKDKSSYSITFSGFKYAPYI